MPDVPSAEKMAVVIELEIFGAAAMKRSTVETHGRLRGVLSDWEQRIRADERERCADVLWTEGWVAEDDRDEVLEDLEMWTRRQATGREPEPPDIHFVRGDKPPKEAPDA